MKGTAVILQLLGIGFTLAGVTVVRAWLERAVDATIEAKRGIARSWALRREALKRRWARLRGRPAAFSVTAHDSAMAHDSASATVTRTPVDRATISLRDWLAVLDDRVESLLQRADLNESAHLEDRAEWSRLLGAQRDEMRDEMLAATRQGWELIVTGLVFTAVGTFLQLWG